MDRLTEADLWCDDPNCTMIHVDLTVLSTRKVVFVEDADA